MLVLRLLKSDLGGIERKAIADPSVISLGLKSDLGGIERPDTVGSMFFARLLKSDLGGIESNKPITDAVVMAG